MPTVAEQMLYSTARIEAMRGGQVISYGTGFYYRIFEPPHVDVPMLVTNKHVLEGADSIRLRCHVATSMDNPEPSGRTVDMTTRLAPQFMMLHPDPDVDLCAVPVASVFESMRRAAGPIYAIFADSSLLPKPDDWENLDAIEPVLMVGCPNGIFDQENNLPIVRSGVTASHPGKRYNGRAEFMVDMACFPGSSGSPVFIHNTGGYLDRRQNAYMIGATRTLLAGILYAGPQITQEGQIVLNRSPRFQVNGMMHLGFVIRSSELLELETIARRLLAEEQARQGNNPTG